MYNSINEIKSNFLQVSFRLENPKYFTEKEIFYCDGVKDNPACWH